MNYQNSAAVVTGGASGLGGATASKLASLGAKVVIADRDAERGAAKAAELGQGATFVQTDVTDAAQVQAALDAASAMAPLRIAVSCAGIGFVARTLNRDGTPHDLGVFEKVIAVNLVGTFNMLRLAAAHMAKNDPDENGERGVIINTASVAAYEGQIGQIAYAASKSGVVGMTIPAARDLSPIGVRVSTIAPGIFDTPMMAALPDKAKQALAQSVVFPKRLGDPAQYADLAAHIIDNPYLNGETIRLDGALRMGPK